MKGNIRDNMLHFYIVNHIIFTLFGSKYVLLLIIKSQRELPHELHYVNQHKASTLIWKINSISRTVYQILMFFN